MLDSGETNVSRGDPMGLFVNCSLHRRRAVHSVARLVLLLFTTALLVHPAFAQGGDGELAKEQSDLAETGRKLSNPVSDVWALFTEFDLSFSNGNMNRGDAQAGAAMVFQPILPLPLTESWKIIVRPTIPITFTQPTPDGFDKFDRKGGLGDILLPLAFSPVLDNWILALGPTFTIPTATNNDLGRQQWAMGPAAIVGYRNEKFVGGVFPQYFWGLGGRGDQKSSTPDASYMNMLYFFFWNLPDAWQIGFNPAITYDHKASRGNKWNVPVGMGFAKTTRVAGKPVKFQFGVEYSVVSQDDFGKRALIKLNIIPVIPSLLKEPLF